VGEKQAYVTTTTTTGQTTNTIAEEVTFVDVGIQFAVTPTINDDGFIVMKVKPEISSVTSILITPTNNKIPIIDTSLTETTVLIKDGTTLIIGGLRKDEKTNSSQGVPLLGKIPLLGYFFKSSTTTTDRTELMVMITPHIITGEEITTGDPRGFGTAPGKEYRNYQRPIAPLYQEEASIGRENTPIRRELPIETEPKSYRDSPQNEDGKVSLKETRYEP
jgi:type II secretory pathway component GspD/PulD (secretin)